MKSRHPLTLILAVIVSVLWFVEIVQATNKFAIDGLHGDLSLNAWERQMDPQSLYPDMQFTWLTAERLPIHEILAWGVFPGNSRDSAAVDVPQGTHSLYFTLVGPVVQYSGNMGQWPYLSLRCPDNSVVGGGRGVVHIDNPVAGHYVAEYSNWEPMTCQYAIATGAQIWEAYPPEDYDAVLDFHTPIWGLFNGEPAPRSAADSIRLRTYLNSGGGIGIFYDGAEPMALKPIIHLQDYPQGEVQVRLDLPGIPTYTVPEPVSRTPLVWNVQDASASTELDYEARFNHNLNFVWRAPGTNVVSNDSWATVHDLKLIEFVRGEGYRINKIGTLAPGEKAAIKSGVLQGYDAAVSELDRELRRKQFPRE